VGWWNFDNNTEDSSGAGNHGVANGGPSWIDVKMGAALEFDGVDDYVQVPDDIVNLKITGDYTFSVWLKADANQKVWASIFSKCDLSSMVNHWTLQFDTSSPKNLIIFHTNNFHNPESWYTGIQLPDIAGASHHVVIVRSGNTMTSYLDGVQRNIDSWNRNPGSGKGHFYIGADRTAKPDFVFKGLIDDVMIYNYALSAQQVSDLYEGK
jgi:sialidase-1